MGGGHVSRPDFGMPQPDPAYPLTEFYQLLQRTLDRTGSFALPALYACLQAPARRIYRDEARECLRLAVAPQEGYTRLQAPARLQLLYSSLHVLPDGTTTALLLTEACTRTVTAVQLLPPVVWEDPLPAAGRSGGADGAADHAGCAGHRHRPGGTGAASGRRPCGKMLAQPPPRRDLSGRTGGTAAESLPMKNGRGSGQAPSFVLPGFMVY